MKRKLKSDGSNGIVLQSDGTYRLLCGSDVYLLDYQDVDGESLGKLRVPRIPPSERNPV